MQFPHLQHGQYQNHHVRDHIDSTRRNHRRARVNAFAGEHRIPDLLPRHAGEDECEQHGGVDGAVGDDERPGGPIGEVLLGDSEDALDLEEEG